MNLGEMQTLLQRYGFDPTDPLTAWLNAAMHDMEADTDWPWLESEVSVVNTVAAQNFVNLPANTLKVVTIKDTTNKNKLSYYNRHRFAREIEDPTEKGRPEIYVLDTASGKIQLWPVPEAAYELEVITQLLTPDLAVAGDEPKTGTGVWPTMAHFPIVQRAAVIALMAENEEERAKTAQEQYRDSLDKLKRKFADRTLDESDTVQDVMDYGAGPGAAARW